MIELSDLDIDNFLAGAAILGTGGGGSPAEGKELLSRVHGRKLRIADVKDLPKDTLAVCPYVVGSITGEIRSPRKLGEMLQVAVSLIEEKVGRKVGATVSTEIGGLNSAIPLYVAGLLDVPLIDGDVVGRAAPEVSHSLVLLSGLDLTPGVAQATTGLSVTVNKYGKVEEYESLLRQLSVQSGYVAVVDSPYPISTVKRMIVRGTMSASLRVGRVRRAALYERSDVTKSLASAIGGYVIFRGIIKSVDMVDKGGFLKGRIKVVGGDGGRSTFESFVMNEHIFGWINGSPIVMPPDSFAFLDEKGTGLSNSEAVIGKKVSVVAWKSAPQWRRREGLKLFGPRHFGFTYDYTPVEKLILERGNLAR